MSEHDQDLGETDSEEIFDFPPVERKIFTQPYDLSLQTLNDQWDNKDLIIPSIQREYVWDNGRASRLIESLILNIPVPPIYFAERHNSVFEVVDGHQRVASIVRYLGNEFALTGLDILSEYTKEQVPPTPRPRAALSEEPNAPSDCHRTTIPSQHEVRGLRASQYRWNCS